MLLSKIENKITSLKNEVISNERKESLQPLIQYIQQKVNEGKNINLNSICTNNSCRSHFTTI